MTSSRHAGPGQHRTRATLAGALLSLAALAAPVAAQCEVLQIVDPDLGNSNFAVGLALQGDDLLVGNGSWLFGGPPCWMYERSADGWTAPPTSLPANTETSLYGSSVAVSGDTAVIAGQDSDNADVCAYVFDRVGGTWVLDEKLLIPLASWQYGSGISVAIEDDTILVSNVYNQTAHFFERSNGDWSLTQTLQPPGLPFVNGWGLGVSLRNGRAVIGGTGPNGALEHAGTAWVYERQGGVFVETAQLLTTGGEEYDQAGESVAQWGDTIVLGARTHSLGFGNQNIGVAFVFEKQAGVWNQTAFLTAPAPKFGDWFGNAVALQGDALFVGAPRRDDVEYNGGAVFLFHRTGSAWEHTTTLYADQPIYNGLYGRALSVDGDTLAVAAPQGPGTGPRAYLVRGAPGLDHWEPTWGAVAGTNGTPCAFGHGTPGPGLPASVGVARALGDAPAWLILGFGRVNAPFLGGILVPRPDAVVPITMDGAGEFDVGWNWPFNASGLELWSQFWVLDGAAPFGVAASNGLSVEVP